MGRSPLLIQKDLVVTNIIRMFVPTLKQKDMDYMDTAWGTPPWMDDPQFECSECGTMMEEDSGVCSGTCFEASML